MLLHRTYPRALSAVLTIALTLSIVGPVPARASSDPLPLGDEIVVSRGDFIRAAVRATSTKVNETVTFLPFTRVAKALRPYVEAAHKKGGLDIFGADLQLARGITRGQAAYVVMKLSPVTRSISDTRFSDVRAGSSFEQAVMTVTEEGWMTPLTDKIFGANRMLLGKDANLLLRKVRGDADPVGAPKLERTEGIPVQKIRVSVQRASPPLPKTQILETIWKLINEEFLYEDKIDADNAAFSAAEAILQSLEDPYTTFLRPVRSRNFQTQLRGQLTGIGAQVEQKDGILTIVTPLRGSPAEAAGLKPGDQILKVDETDLTGLGFLEAVEHVRGPKGSTAKLRIRRNGIEQDINVTRDVIKVPEIEISWQEDIPIVHLLQFGQVTQLELRNEISNIQRNSPKGFILDLRNNPGGLLDAASVVLSNFVPSGTVVAKIKSRTSEREQRTISEPTLAMSVPMVVLVNKGSASASEIVAGALQDHGRATVIGETTFGKGTVQQVIQFNDQSSVKMTVAEWLTPSSRRIDGQGITPDIVVEENGRDEQLLEALKVLRR